MYIYYKFFTFNLFKILSQEVNHSNVSKSEDLRSFRLFQKMPHIVTDVCSDLHSKDTQRRRWGTETPVYSVSVPPSEVQRRYSRLLKSLAQCSTDWNFQGPPNRGFLKSKHHSLGLFKWKTLSHIWPMGDFQPANWCCTDYSLRASLSAFTEHLCNKGVSIRCSAISYSVS